MSSHSRILSVASVLTLSVLLQLPPRGALAQKFDFKRLEKQVQAYTVIIDIKLEASFGIQTAEQDERYIGTIVSDDGLVMFDGSLLGDNPLGGAGGFSIKITPISIEILTLDGTKYPGEFIGVDRFTQLGFIRIDAENERFTPISFQTDRDFAVGEWLTLYMLLPEFVTPPLASDVGMVSSVVTSPEVFPLTVGFAPSQMTSVLFDEDLQPVGVLGRLLDPSRANIGASGLIEGFDQGSVSMLGVIVGERLEKLIADPPVKGESDRGWLGISLQALTSEMIDFWGLDVSGGIIVNDIIANSPAERSGLSIGDVIFEVNGQEVGVDKEEKLPIFQRFIAELGPDAEVELGVIRRDGSRVDSLRLLATLERAPLAATDAPTYEIEALELKVRNLVFADYLFHNQDQETFTGVVVSELKRGGLADIGGLRLGDVIQRIDNTPVGSIAEVEAVMTRLKDSRPREVIFFVWRNSKTLFVNVKTDWKQ